MPHTPIPSPTKKKIFQKKQPFTNLDRAVLLVSVVYPFSALPQVIAVFSGPTEGVAVFSWAVFLICASLFFVYGLRRHVMPMIVSNSIWIVMDALVVSGILFNSAPITWI